MRVCILTLGCKTNQAESSVLEAGFRARGWSVVGLEDHPDICVINTCSVTAKTDYQSRQLIRRAHKARSRVVVTGCYSQLNRDLVATMEGVDIVVDNSDKAHIDNMLSDETSGSLVDCAANGKSRLFLKVQDGCNGTCSYCIIPKARGSSRSTDPDSIVRQIAACSSVFKEVVLTAIHLGTYGYDLRPKVSLSYLIRRCLSETGVRRIRLSSIEITELDEDLLKILGDTRICRHLHIPLQSGDDGILAAMNRSYGTVFFREKISEIQRLIPEICIGTDVIAGFPGESDQAFRNTYDLLEYLPISYIHVFPFSARPGTRAAELAGRVAPAVIRKRCDQLRRLSERKKSAYMKRQIGQSLELLVEEMEGPDSVVGTTGNYLKARAFVSGIPPKELVAVGIAGIDEDLLVAYPIEFSEVSESKAFPACLKPAQRR